jgi:site-specific recombinase XerC
MITYGSLLADCSGKDFRNRRDCAIIRLFLATGMRLEGMSGLRYRADDPEFSDVDLTSRGAHDSQGPLELVLPAGGKSSARHRQVCLCVCRSPA